MPVLSRLSVAPFDSWDYEDAVREVKATYDADTYTIQKSYAEDHDHYRRGQEWTGPGTAAATSGSIHNSFAPDDAIGAVLGNIENAFSEPQIGLVPKDGSDPTDAEATELKTLLNWLGVWWDREKMHQKVQNAQRQTAWAGVAGLRMWIPWRFLIKTTDESGNVGIGVQPTNDFEKALSFIKVTTALPESLRFVTDPATQDVCAVYLEDEVTWKTVNGRKVKDTVKKAELMYLDPQRDDDSEADTIIRVVYSNKEHASTITRIPLKGELLYAEMSGRTLLTDPVVRTQRQLNLLTTLVGRIAETAAFRERYILNAKPQGRRVTYTEGDDIPDGAFLERDEESRLWVVIPEARTLGASTTTELVGLPENNESGEPKKTGTPDVKVMDPVDPKPYIDAANAARARILKMCSQGHLSGSSNFEVSGIAYEQARAVFEKDLDRRRVSEEGMLRDFLTATLALAEAITGQEGAYTDKYRVTVDQHINPGPRSPDLVRLDLEAYEAGILSRETVQARIGIEDLEAEELRIKESTAHILDIVSQIVEMGMTGDNARALLTQLGLPAEIVNAVDIAEPVAPVIEQIDTDEN